MFGWKRLSGSGREIVAGGLFAAGAAFAICVSVNMWTADRGDWEDVGPVTGGLVIYGFFAVWFTAVWRMFWIGIYASPAKVRIRSLLRTQTFPWSWIASVDVEPAQYAGIETARPAIWFTLNDGRRVETPVQRSIGWPGMQFVKRSGPVLDTCDFDYLVVQLRERRAAVDQGA